MCPVAEVLQVHGARPIWNLRRRCMRHYQCPDGATRYSPVQRIEIHSPPDLVMFLLRSMNGM